MQVLDCWASTPFGADYVFTTVHNYVVYVCVCPQPQPPKPTPQQEPN